jgi:hypothetical protein
MWRVPAAAAVSSFRSVRGANRPRPKAVGIPDRARREQFLNRSHVKDRLSCRAEDRAMHCASCGRHEHNERFAALRYLERLASLGNPLHQRQTCGLELGCGDLLHVTILSWSPRDVRLLKPVIGAHEVCRQIGAGHRHGRRCWENGIRTSAAEISRAHWYGGRRSAFCGRRSFRRCSTTS